MKEGMRTLTLSCIVILALLCVTGAGTASAAVDFDVLSQDVEINIYEDWSSEIWYYLSIETTSGPQSGIYLGLPDANISDYAASVDGELLSVEQTTYDGGDVLKIFFPEQTYPGDITDLRVSFWAYERLFPDETDSDYIGMYFIPSSWQGRTVEKQSVTYILPEGVTPDTVKFVPNPDSMSLEGRLEVYFEKTDSLPEDFSTNVLFPLSFLVPEDEKRINPDSGSDLPTWLIFMVGAAILFAVIAVIAAVAYVVSRSRKRPYKKPELAMGTMGVRKDLDNVEAAVLLSADPVKIVNLIVLGLVKKGLAKVESWGPLKMELIKELKEEEASKCPNCGAPIKTDVKFQKCGYCGSEIEMKGRPAYYDNQFMLHALGPDGTLDKKGMRMTMEALSKKVSEKMRGYNRNDSEKFYREKIAAAWGDVSSASEDERFKLFGEQMGWLMLDKEYDSKVDSSFGSIGSMWVPASWWVWYSLGRSRSMSGSEFADKAKETNVLSDQKFGVKSSALKTALATPAAVAHAHKSGCACACVNCACACACVSCACACASGGGF